MGIENIQTGKFICDSCGKESVEFVNKLEIGDALIRLTGRPPAGWITLLGNVNDGVVCSVSCLRNYAEKYEVDGIWTRNMTKPNQR